MITYIVQSEPGKPNFTREIIPGSKAIWVDIVNYGKNSSLVFDKHYMVTRYGFPLSDYEVNYFNTHFEIWKKFKISGFSKCLIINDNIDFELPRQNHINILKGILNADNDWDVFLPYERDEIRKDAFDFSYLLGTYWGIDAYCVSKKGVDKLLRIHTIRQPIDEEILTKSMLGQIELYAQDCKCINFKKNLTLEKEREKTIKKAIFQTDCWPPGSKNAVRKILIEISELSIRSNIELILSDGSLLAYVRHGNIMPWDDDVDLSINENDFKAFSDLIKKSTNLRHRICLWGPEKIPYCKIWGKQGVSIRGYDYSFPFVDIWFFKELNEDIVFNTGFRFKKNIYYPLSIVSFEGSLFKIPYQPQKCLDLLYEDWRDKIRVYPWSHRLERSEFPPLYCNIVVDENGRLILEESNFI